MCRLPECLRKYMQRIHYEEVWQPKQVQLVFPRELYLVIPVTDLFRYSEVISKMAQFGTKTLYQPFTDLALARLRAWSKICISGSFLSTSR